jgi:hypothetical protein
MNIFINIKNQIKFKINTIKLLILSDKNYKIYGKQLELSQNLLFDCDINKQNKSGNNLWIAFIEKDDEKVLSWSSQAISVLISKINLQQQNQRGENFLMSMIRNSAMNNIILAENDWNYLIQNSDLQKKTDSNENVLMYGLKYQKNFSEKQWDYLIENSKVTLINNQRENSLLMALRNREKLTLNDSQIQKIYNGLSYEIQKETFLKLIHDPVKVYQKEIEFMIIKCNFEPHQWIINQLKNHQQKEILKIIEKRNIEKKLENNFNQEENTIKYKL